MIRTFVENIKITEVLTKIFRQFAHGIVGGIKTLEIVGKTKTMYLKGKIKSQDIIGKIKKL